MGVQGKMAWLTVVAFAVDGTTLAPQLAQTLTNSARTQLTHSASALSRTQLTHSALTIKHAYLFSVASFELFKSLKKGESLSVNESNRM